MSIVVGLFVDVVIVCLVLLDFIVIMLLGQICMFCLEIICIVLVEVSVGICLLLVCLIGVVYCFLLMLLVLEVLLEVLISLEELCELFDSECLCSVIGWIEKLFLLLYLYLSLIQVLEYDDDIDIVDVVKLVVVDLVIVVKVLQLFNLVFFNSGWIIFDLCIVVIWLGLLMLCDLVLVSEVFLVQLLFGVECNLLQQCVLLVLCLVVKLLLDFSVELGVMVVLFVDIGLLLLGVCNEWVDVVDGDDCLGYVEVGVYLLGLWGLLMLIIEVVVFYLQLQCFNIWSFWVIGVVYVVLVLINGDLVDEEYLQCVGVFNKLLQWCDYVNVLMGLVVVDV